MSSRSTQGRRRRTNHGHTEDHHDQSRTGRGRPSAGRDSRQVGGTHTRRRPGDGQSLDRNNVRERSAACLVLVVLLEGRNPPGQRHTDSSSAAPNSPRALTLSRTTGPVRSEPDPCPDAHDLDDGRSAPAPCAVGLRPSLLRWCGAHQQPASARAAVGPAPGAQGERELVLNVAEQRVPAPGLSWNVGRPPRSPATCAPHWLAHAGGTSA